jgi:hypothetical protein
VEPLRGEVWDAEMPQMGDHPLVVLTVNRLRQSCGVADKDLLHQYVVDALAALGGEGTVVQVSKEIWRQHRDDLERAGDLFYTWQYDVRWAAQVLRDQGVLEPAAGSRRPWRLASPPDA